MTNIFNAYNKSFNLLLAEIEVAHHEVALKLKLTDSAMLILYTAYLGGGSCLLSDITLWASKQTVNSALRKLEADGIVALTAVDGRKKKVLLTEKGRELTQNTVQRWIHAENSITDQWTEAERQIYFDLTRRYLQTLKEKLREL